ncbi:putative membrane protein [Halorhabdus sp. SVX81]|uniref:hypothetical protein n=1 Tax=Halorhabdus sp. SVX81 TaxID=2978283 RepID=UPI0023DBFC09|nr:hypothetical protein [Halorhabdus sp. SVX81]WEL18149.1 putative membrane protein [Halorhabdus sp. SVX81]
MNNNQYLPSDQPLAAALRIAPRILFLTGCSLGVLTIVPVSSVSGIQTGRLGTGAFALALAVVAGMGVASGQYLRPMVAIALGAALGAITIGAVTIIDVAVVAQLTMIAYLIWTFITHLTNVGIHQDEDPSVADSPRGEWPK